MDQDWARSIGKGPVMNPAIDRLLILYQKEKHQYIKQFQQMSKMNINKYTLYIYMRKSWSNFHVSLSLNEYLIHSTEFELAIQCAIEWIKCVGLHAHNSYCHNCMLCNSLKYRY